MLNVIIFLVGALIMFYMALRSVRARQQLRTKGVCVQATVSGTVQSRDGAAYVLEFTTAGGSHRLHYPKAAKGKGFAEGVTLADGTALSPAEVEALTPDGLTVKVRLRQGVYHQIKRMFGVFDAGVNALHREVIGPVALDAALVPGQWRELTAEEVNALRAAAKPKN